MELLRDRQSALYRCFGVFRFQEILCSAGITGPSRVIVATARFVEQVLARADPCPDPKDVDGAAKWITTKLLESLPALTDNPDAEPLQLLFARSAEALDWSPYQDFAELLHVSCGPQAYESALHRLSSRGFPAWELDLLSLEDEFVRLRLPHALRSFDLARGIGKETAWLAQVFYRHALKAALRDRIHRQRLESLEHLPASAAADDLLQSSEQAEYLGRVQEEMRNLPEPERTAVTMYFGFGENREATVKEIANAIGSTEHLARAAVVRAVARLAVRLNVRGVLSREEFELISLLYLDCLDLKSAADRLGLHLNDARQLSARAGRKLASLLRPRTSPQQGLSKPKNFDAASPDLPPGSDHHSE